MDQAEISKIIIDMYFNSKDDETVAMIHLFKIKYADQFKAPVYPMFWIATPNSRGEFPFGQVLRLRSN